MAASASPRRQSRPPGPVPAYDFAAVLRFFQPMVRPRALRAADFATFWPPKPTATGRWLKWHLTA